LTPTRTAHSALTAGLALLLFAGTALAQSIEGEDAWPSDAAPLGDGVAAGVARDRAYAKAPPHAGRRVRLSSLDVPALRRADDDRRAALGDEWKRWNRVGIVRDLRPVTVPPTPSRWTRAETLSDGSRVFRIEIAAPGAEGLRVRFRACDVPKGSEITVHDADEPAESYGPLRVAATLDEPWFGPTVFGSRAVVVLRVPAAKLDERVRLTVDGVSQRYRPPEESDLDGGPRALPVDAHGELRATGCIKSVACDAGYVADVARGVARFEFTTGGNTYLCSGTLLADIDTSTQVPWFLTANHCVSTDKTARTMEIYWDYRLPSCGGSTPNLFSVPRTLGATLSVTSGDTDCTLVRITGSLPSNRFFCGWTAARPVAGDAVVGVHHPEGSHMRISYGTLDSSNAHFHTVVWSDGVTAQGSSGSALFNSRKQVVGQLCCGSSFCSRPRDPDDYGRLDVSYSTILKPSLGVDPTPLAPDAWDPGDDTSAGATDLGEPTMSGVSHGPHTLAGTDAADWFSADLAASVPFLVESTGAVRADAFSDAAGTQLVATAAGGFSGFTLQVATAVAGRHWIRVRRASPGVDAEYRLQVSRQDTTPPRAVAKLRAASKSGGRALLTWTDRAKDENGYRVEMLGASGWVRVGELPAGTKRFVHRPGPGNQLYRVGPYDLLTTNWREVAVKVRGRPGLDAWDPVDDTGAGATDLGTSIDGLTPAHELDRNDAADWFRIDLVSGETWALETQSDGDTVGTLFSDAGGLSPLADADDQHDGSGAVLDADFRLVFTAPATGTYWLRVAAFPSTPRATYSLGFRLQ